MEHVQIAHEGAVGIITLDRAARFNSLDVTTAQDLRRAGLQMARDESVRAVVLRGTAGAFCSGADLKYIAAGGEPCDLVIASSRATFEWAYGKTGLTGAESSTFLLPRLIGLRRCMELMLLNPRIGADQAVAMGLATRVLPVDAFDAAVLDLAQGLAAGPTRAFGTAKALINQAA